MRDRNHAMVFQQARQPAFQRAHGVLRKLLRAEGRIGRDADVSPPAHAIM